MEPSHDSLRRDHRNTDFSHIIARFLQIVRSEEHREEDSNDLASVQTTVVDVDRSEVVRDELNEVAKVLLLRKINA